MSEICQKDDRKMSKCQNVEMLECQNVRTGTGKGLTD